LAVKRSHSLSIGIVGLPNSGKSTIFNALTQSAVPAENYPFCTIDKNVGVVKIPDPRLAKMANFLKSDEIVPSAMTFVDIAGLVKGASKGEGLGNKFLSHIREADAIMYTLRAFHGEEIAHVYERISPADDLKIVRSELILKDITTVERKLGEIKDHAKSGMTDELELKIETLEKILQGLSNEKPAYTVEIKDEAREFLRDLWLLTNKPAFYVLNIKGGIDEPQLKKWIQELKQTIPDQEKDFIILIDCRMEVDIVDLEESEKSELIEMVDDYHSTKDIIEMAYNRLNLLTFYTGNEKVANAWTIEKGATVKEAAGVIHTDLEQNFVASEVVNVEELINAAGWNAAKENGLIRSEGKDYVVQDGDYVNILANK
jgi:hypothetical protein